MTTTHRVAVIGGDGIGPEVTAEALKVIRAAGVHLDIMVQDQHRYDVIVTHNLFGDTIAARVASIA